MSKNRHPTKREVIHGIILSLFFIVLCAGAFYLVKETEQGLIGNVIGVSNTTGNSSLVLFDDGDRDRNAGGKVSYLEVNNLFNETSNIYFFANLTNLTGFAMSSASGSSCAIEFETGAGGNTGPFAMVFNSSIGMFEYNRSFPGNGTFIWNATCSNGNAGIGSVRAYDTVRIFGVGCTSAVLESNITNNTVICSGTYSLNPAGSTALYIRNNNITLDCNGSTIRGSGTGIGIALGNYNGTVLKNCRFQNYGNGSVYSLYGQHKDNILLFNNTLSDSPVLMNLSFIGNVTIQNSSFNNFTTGALDVYNITNATVLFNEFCGGTAFANATGTVTANVSNNTICTTLVFPANNTDMYDINFTFNNLWISQVRMRCTLFANNQSSGRYRGLGVEKNITLNTSLYQGQQVLWNVTCDDSYGNTGVSQTRNVTYRSCTVPTVNMSFPASTNVTFCPGRYELNATGILPMATVTSNNDTFLHCNNTILIGNGGSNIAGIALENDVFRYSIRHCFIGNVQRVIAASSVNTLTLGNITIFNNTFNSTNGVLVEWGSYYNFTNNTFNGTILSLSNVSNNYIINNTFTVEGGNTHLLLNNSVNTTILWNNITHNQASAIEIYFGNIIPTTPIRPQFEQLIANNTVCRPPGVTGSPNTNDILIDNFRLTTSPILDGLLANNTFCNFSSNEANRSIARVQWTIQVNVVNATNNSINSAMVNITDFSNTSVVTGLMTNQTGFTNETRVTQFIVDNSSTLINLTPTTFNASKNTEKTNLTLTIDSIRSATTNNVIIINLSQDATPPSVTQIIPITGTVEQAINFTANVTDQTGVQSCSFFSGSSNTSTTTQGIMGYSLSDNVTNKTFSYGTAGTYFVYANCSDNGGNTWYNLTEINITGGIVPGDGGDEEEEGGGGETEPEPEIEVIVEPEPVLEEETDEEQESMGNEVLKIVEIIVDDETVYEDNQFINPIAMQDYDQLIITIILENPEAIPVTNVDLIIENLPEEITAFLDPEEIEIINAGEQIIVTLTLESSGIEDGFTFSFDARGDGNAQTGVEFNIMLEEGVESLDYTRESIVEQVVSVLSFLYKFLFLLFLIPLLLLLRMTTIADEKALRYIVETKKIQKYRKVYVTKETYLKYDTLQNLKPISLTEQEELRARNLLRLGISYELAQGIIYATTCLVPRVYTLETVPQPIRHMYSRILFTSPAKAVQEEALKRYITKEQRKGFTNDEIRRRLQAAGWKLEIIKKYLDPEKDLEVFVKMQKAKGRNMESIRNELLALGWSREIVQKYITEEELLHAHIMIEREHGKTNKQIRSELFTTGWDKEFVEKYLDPRDDVRAYIIACQQRGMERKQVLQNLLAAGWSKEQILSALRKFKKQQM